MALMDRARSVSGCERKGWLKGRHHQLRSGEAEMLPYRSKRCAMCTTELQDGLAKINSYYQTLDRYFAGVIGSRQSRLLIL
jgi:hypothetical protein